MRERLPSTNRHGGDRQRSILQEDVPVSGKEPQDAGSAGMGQERFLAYEEETPERHISVAQELFTGNDTEIRRHPETA